MYTNFSLEEVIAAVDDFLVKLYPGTDVLASIILGTDSQQRDAIFTQRSWQNLLLQNFISRYSMGNGQSGIFVQSEKFTN